MAVGSNNYLPGAEIIESEELCIEFVNKGQAEFVEIVEQEVADKKQKRKTKLEE